MSKYYCLFAIMTFYGVSGASQGFQTDWSGSNGVIGPVIQLGTDYWYDSDVNGLAYPGDLVLEYSSQGVPVSVIDHSQVVLLDFDQDGDQDIAAVADSPDGFRMFENADGQGTLWNEFMIATVSGYAWTVTAGDFTGDGYPDLVGTDESYNDLLLMTNPAGPGSWDVSFVDDDRAAYCLEPADLNGDGLLDIVGGHSYPEFLCCWINLGGGSWEFHSVGGSYVPSDIDVGDVDQDGDLDIFMASSLGGHLAWYRNSNGQGTSWQHVYIMGGIEHINGVSCGDADGDGDLDLATSRFQQNVSYWENVDGTGQDWESTLLEVVSQCQSVLMADLDQDGDLDIAAVSVLKDYIPIFLNDGTAQNWTRHEISPVTSPRRIRDCDLNSDGALDLLVSSSSTDTLLWMDDLCSYTGGYLESSIIQVSIGVPDSTWWGTITWDATVPAGTSVGFNLRGSDDFFDLQSTQWSDTITVSGTSLEGLFPEDCMYAQYATALSTSDQSVTPALHELIFDWVVQGIEHGGDQPLLRILENPVNGAAGIEYHMNGVAGSRLTVYDMTGRTVRSYGPEAPGTGTLCIQGLPPGVYTVVMHCGSETLTDKFVQLER